MVELSIEYFKDYLEDVAAAYREKADRDIEIAKARQAQQDRAEKELASGISDGFYVLVDYVTTEQSTRYGDRIEVKDLKEIPIDEKFTVKTLSQRTKSMRTYSSQLVLRSPAKDVEDIGISKEELDEFLDILDQLGIRHGESSNYSGYVNYHWTGYTFAVAIPVIKVWPSNVEGVNGTLYCYSDSESDWVSWTDVKKEIKKLLPEKLLFCFEH